MVKTILPRSTGYRILLGLALLLSGLLIFAWLLARECRALYCVLQPGSAITKCGNISPAQLVQKLPLSDAQDLIIEHTSVTRQASSLSISVTLKGKFWNESDQNLYVFIGKALPGGATASYSLSSDEQYFADLSYAVHNTVVLPHSNDVRLGIMAPREAAYTPQVYTTDPVQATLVGHDAHVRMQVDEHQVRLEFPLDEYYQFKQAPVPEQLSVTLATARDYVGFIDQISVIDVAPDETKDADRKSTPPALYPMLNYDSHLFRSVQMEETNGRLRIELEMGAEIADWAQTNLYFLFVPYPPAASKVRPLDPSKTITLPYQWSFYCGVYSPGRIFCKASNGVDFTYDQGYAERSRLEKPAGVQFSALGNARYALELTSENVEQIKAGRETFALLLMAGRDGFGPTSVYGWNTSNRCRSLRRFIGFSLPTRVTLDPSASGSPLWQERCADESIGASP